MLWTTIKVKMYEEENEQKNKWTKEYANEAWNQVSAVCLWKTTSVCDMALYHFLWEAMVFVYLHLHFAFGNSCSIFRLRAINGPILVVMVENVITPPLRMFPNYCMTFNTRGRLIHILAACCQFLPRIRPLLLYRQSEICPLREIM